MSDAPPFSRMPPFDVLSAALTLPDKRARDDDFARVRAHDVEELWDHARAPHVAASYAARMSVLVGLALDATNGRGSVLDVGCAQGTLGLTLAAHGRRVTLLDVRGGHIEYARARYRGNGVNFVASRLSEGSPAENDFDLVVCTEVIEHVPAPAGLLTLLASKVRLGGALLLTTPNADYAMSRLPTFGSAPQHVLDEAEQDSADGDSHRYLFTREELVSLARGAGLRVEQHGFFLPLWVEGHLKTRWLHRAFFRARGRIARLSATAAGGQSRVDRTLCASQWMLARRPAGGPP